MRAAIFNPYLDSLGGGERYTASFAKVLLDLGYEVEFEWKNEGIIKKIENRFGIDLKGARCVKDIKRGDGYDICFWVSDGSIPMLKARNNILHFQIPFKDVGGDSLFNKMKLIRINKVVCNSGFTKQFIDSEYQTKSLVVYPPVDTDKFQSRKKENIILYVGRFSDLKQSKKQDVLVRVFKKMCDKGLKGWKLVLAGGVEIGSGKFVRKIEKMVEDYPIEIYKSPNFKTIQSLFGRSKIFWSAAGFGVDESSCPEKCEHFGISLVEAMSSSCVPIVFKAGGHREIIKNNENGFFWNKTNELAQITLDLIGDKKKLSDISLKAKKGSGIYSYEEFERKVKDII